MQKKQTGLLTPYAKVNSKWIKDGRPEHKGCTAPDISLSSTCVALSPQAREQKQESTHGTIVH